MSVKNIRALLAANRDVGAGSVLTARMSYGRRVVTDILLRLRAGADRDRDYAKDVGAVIDEDVFATLRDVVVVDEDSIPLGPTGKVRKVVLRERHLEERGAR